MPEFTGSLRSLGSFDPGTLVDRGGMAESRIGLGGSVGDRRGGMWSCVTRSKSEVAENIQVAREFQAKLVDTFGEDIAKELSKDLKSHLEKGRPLSLYRLTTIVAKGRELAGHNIAQNDGVLKGAMPQILKGTGTHPPKVPNQEALEKAIRDALESDPEYLKARFTDSSDIIGTRFGKIAEEARDREVLRQMRPHSHRLVSPGLRKPTDSIALALQKMPPGLSDVQKQRFINGEKFLGEVQDLVTSPDLQPGDIQKGLDQLARMSELLKPGGSPTDDSCVCARPGEPPLSPEAEKRRDAMLKDMEHLRGALLERLGMEDGGGLSIAQGNAIRGLNTRLNTLDKEITDGSIDKAKVGEHLTAIRDEIEVLEGIATPTDAQQAVIDVLKARAEVIQGKLEMIALFDKYDVSPTDLAALGRMGVDISAMRPMLPSDPTTVDPHVKELVDGMKQLAGTHDALRTNQWDSEALDTSLDATLQALRDFQVTLDETVVPSGSTPFGDMIGTLKTETSKAIKDLEGAKVARERGFSSEQIREARENGVTDLKAFAERFSPEEVAILKENNIPSSIALQYKEAGLTITEELAVDEFTEDRVTGTPTPLSLSPGGPVRLQYNLGDDDVDDVRDVVFRPIKPGIPERTPAGTRLGIDESTGGALQRQQAVGRVDQLLTRAMGLDPDQGLVPQSRMGTHDGQLGIVTDFPRGEMSTTSGEHNLRTAGGTGRQELLRKLEEAEGDDPEVVSDELSLLLSQNKLERRVVDGTPEYIFKELPTDMNSPQLRRDMTRLQLLDALTGQVDRHPGNYVMVFDGRNYVGLRALDNEKCLGSHSDNPDLIGPPPGARDVQGVRLPSVIDKSMARAISNMRPDDLRESLQGCSEEEIQSALKRLEGLKTHVLKLETLGSVIEDNEWGSGEAIQASGDSRTSLLALSRELREYGRRVYLTGEGE
ncbi:hypothetical protein DB346_03480 [Verrucomicrobia bacterium LW23]|nr:hypothetical protein DB346_03480 [Verrucomicrobia bacterium LW23]